MRPEGATRQQGLRSAASVLPRRLIGTAEHIAAGELSQAGPYAAVLERLRPAQQVLFQMLANPVPEPGGWGAAGANRVPGQHRHGPAAESLAGRDQDNQRELSRGRSATGG